VHRWLAGGEAPRNHDADVERARQEIAQLGLDPDKVMGEWAAPPEKVPDLVLPIALRSAVQVFVACATQWEYVTPGLGAPIVSGLNYSRLESVMNMKGIAAAERPAVFEDVRFMEAVALPLLTA
jgi:hypothetical protein